jgi:uncharacterized protein (DUF1499 family)
MIYLALLAIYVVPLLLLRASSSKKDGRIHKTAKDINKAKLYILGFYALMLAPIYGLDIPFLGKIADFSNLENRSSPNEYLIAPATFTPARVHEEPPVFHIAYEELKQIVKDTIMKQPRVTFLREDIESDRLLFIQRTPILRFPDVITIQIIPVGSDKTTIAAYSTSVYGYSDLGVNKARLTTWLAEIINAVPYSGAAL